LVPSGDAHDFKCFNTLPSCENIAFHSLHFGICLDCCRSCIACETWRFVKAISEVSWWSNSKLYYGHRLAILLSHEKVVRLENKIQHTTCFFLKFVTTLENQMFGRSLSKSMLKAEI
jgi:hypothetical protein